MAKRKTNTVKQEPSAPASLYNSILSTSKKKTYSIKEKNSYNAYELYRHNQKELPKLLEPFFQKVGVAALVGTSDTGKSTLLRQLALAISLKQDHFLGFPLNCEHNWVLYVSTEDDYTSVSYAIRKQVNRIRDIAGQDKLDLKLLENLEFIFYADNIFTDISNRLDKKSYDLIVIDAFADVFEQEINANTQVRKFLNGFDGLAKRYGCLVIFLHHIGKYKDKKSPSKDSIIGSQAFEAKMRSVLELRPNKNDETLRDLWVLKANFLKKSFKSKSYVLEFNDLYFDNTDRRGTGNATKQDNPSAIKKVMELHKKGLSLRDIEEKLKDTPYAMGKSTVGKIVKEFNNK